MDLHRQRGIRGWPPDRRGDEGINTVLRGRHLLQESEHSPHRDSSTSGLHHRAEVARMDMRGPYSRRAVVVGLHVDVAKRGRADTTQPKLARGLGDTGHEAEFRVGGV